ncbi:ABC transporter ATP-binding protein/permease [Fructilactobacillus hinvesii]|uniref:ABC transporter ATP-binding protein/permease n=1 Tax=Fructilactobacillus hinvesii TaxID=2940300 RepID=A0ABY5BT39_9LACO|nr:ABC transporter ATP-binding protein [Fructilactobacillus hinvesii]USS88257.1 ABC transporter ATP-binding protein/permease [Fructilactobacillus hinvesii]
MKQKQSRWQHFTEYLRQLEKTYRLFGAAAPQAAGWLMVLLPLQAVLPLVAVQAGQQIINQLVQRHPIWASFAIWLVAMAVTQILPTITLFVQGILTDKLTGFLNLKLMGKSKELKSLNLFDNSKYFDDLQMLKSDDSWRPVNLIVFGLSIVQQSIMLVVMFVMLARYNWWLTLALIAVLVPQSISYYRIQQDAFETMVTRSKNARKLNYYSSLLLDRLDAKEVRLFNMFTPIITKYRRLFNQTQSQVNQVRRKQALVGTSYLILVVAVTGYGFYWFITAVQTGTYQMGVLLLYITLMGYISSSMAKLVEDSSLLYDSLLWIEKFYHFIDFQDDLHDGRQPFPIDFQTVSVQNVSFHYPFSDQLVLKHVNFTVQRGEKIAIVGENGSGKSTLVKLLLRFYDPSAGQIQLDQQNVQTIEINAYRQAFSATFQDFSKFKLSLGENVAAAHAYDPTYVKNLLAQVGLASYLQQKNVQLTTMMSKEFAHGTDASGGQWQRIALARDLYADGQIEFLDEPTAALDPRSEQEIYQTFLQQNRHKTVFFVTHRLSAVQYADRVLMLQNGRVTGFASHAELLQTNPEYAELYNLQKAAYQ